MGKAGDTPRPASRAAAPLDTLPDRSVEWAGSVREAIASLAMEGHTRWKLPGWTPTDGSTPPGLPVETTRDLAREEGEATWRKPRH